METTTEVVYTALLETSQAIQSNTEITNQLLASINGYMQGALILLICVFVYKFITMFTGT